jgi:hypothetical protein
MEEIEEVFEEPVIEQPIKVYVKVNTNNEIIEVDSSVFIQDTTDWVEIDSGFGDNYAHAQSQYFENPLMNEDGAYNYLLINGMITQKL